MEDSGGQIPNTGGVCHGVVDQMARQRGTVDIKTQLSCHGFVTIVLQNNHGMQAYAGNTGYGLDSLQKVA